MKKERAERRYLACSGLTKLTQDTAQVKSVDMVCHIHAALTHIDVWGHRARICSKKQ